jgi:hypothetical protein
MLRKYGYACLSYPIPSVLLLTTYPALSRIFPLLRHLRSLRHARRKQICLPRRHQESLLRPSKEIPPRYQQRTKRKRKILRRPSRLRNPLRHGKEEGLRFIRRCSFRFLWRLQPRCRCRRWRTRRQPIWRLWRLWRCTRWRRLCTRYQFRGSVQRFQWCGWWEEGKGKEKSI